jgi:hypothetical protein
VATLTIADAARCCRVARSTLQRAIQAGRLSLTRDHRVDTAELLRAGYTLHAAQQPHEPTDAADARRDAAAREPDAAAATAQPASRSSSESAALQQRLETLEQENARLQDELAASRQLSTWLRQLHETTLQQHAENMQRFDRVREAGRPAPVPYHPAPVIVSHPHRGDMRQRILTLLREYSDGLSPAQTRQRLGTQKDLGSTMKAMLRDGLLRRVAPGQYTAAD